MIVKNTSLKNERIELRLNSELLDRIDEWKLKNRKTEMTRSEIIRRLIMNQTNNFALTMEQRFIALLNIENLIQGAELGLNSISKNATCTFHNRSQFFDSDTLKLLRKSISEGHDWAIPQILNGVIFKSDCNEDMEFVFNVLDFFRRLNHSITACSPEEQNIINKSDQFAFEGFDANNESELFTICDFIIHDLHRYEEQSNVDLHAHTPMYPKYKKLLEMAETINSPEYLWSFDEISKIIKYKEFL